MKVILWTKRLALTGSFAALLTTNVLTLTHSAFNTALSGFAATAFGIQTVSDVLRHQLDKKDHTIQKQQAAAAKNKAANAKRKAAAKRFGSRLTARTKRVAVESIAAIPGEAVPVIGVSLLIAGTAYELFEACNSIKDLDVLFAELGIEDENPDDVLDLVCNPSIPGLDSPA